MWFRPQVQATSADDVVDDDGIPPEVLDRIVQRIRSHVEQRRRPAGHRGKWLQHAAGPVLTCSSPPEPTRVSPERSHPVMITHLHQPIDGIPGFSDSSAMAGSRITLHAEPVRGADLPV